MQIFVALCLFVWGAGQASAQTVTPSEPIPVTEVGPVHIGQRIEMKSEVLSTTISMWVSVPESFHESSSDHTYPVLFINGAHGQQFFSAVAGVVKHLGDRERIPETIVVSLNEMGDIPEVFTHGMWDREKLGGGENHRAGLEHLEKEVFPYLEKTYRANDFRMMIGISGSTLFPIYAFTDAPDFFAAHIWIAAADMIGMGYSEDTTFIDTFEGAWTRSPERRAYLYLGVAESDLSKRDDYRDNLKELKTRLGRFDALSLKVEVVQRDDHYAVLLRGLLSALDQIFPHERWSSRYRDLVAQPGNALENIDRYYRRLSKEYGFTVLPRADRWNNVNSLRFMTRHLIRLERFEEALEVAERRVEYRPGDPGSFAGLADAYEANGRLAEAVEAQAKALVMVKSEGRDWEERYEQRLEELKGKTASTGP